MGKLNLSMATVMRRLTHAHRKPAPRLSIGRGMRRIVKRNKLGVFFAWLKTSAEPKQEVSP